MVDVAKAIASHRVIREFADRPLDERDLRRILDAGRRAGSSKNSQRWAFIVCRDRAHLRELSTLGRYAGHLAGATVAPDPRAGRPSPSVMWDLGGAAASMMLAAWDLGIGSAPATVYDQGRARELLGYPADLSCEFILSFGYPADPGALTAPLRKGGRRPLDELLHEERW